MRFVQWILGRKQESQHAKAVTRNMPKTVMWLLRHRASRQNYDVYTHIYIYYVGEPVIRAVVSPAVVLTWFLKGHIPISLKARDRLQTSINSSISYVAQGPNIS